MVIYEVNLNVQKAVQSDFEAWLKKHVSEMLEIDGFVKCDVLMDTDASDTANYVCHYHMESRAHLDTYFKEHAPRMREDGLKKFPDQFSASRRILEAL